VDMVDLGKVVNGTAPPLHDLTSACKSGDNIGAATTT
jgi:hypothetical protein